jgi:hypothetical protein
MVAIGEVSQHGRVLNAVVGTLQCRSLEGYDGEKMVWHIWFLAPESSNGNHPSDHWSLALERMFGHAM